MAEEILQAKRYAQAVFEIARDSQELDAWQSDLRRIAALAAIPDIASAMENPKFDMEKKTGLLDSQLRGLRQAAMNLTRILTSRGKFTLITAIFEEYQNLLDDYHGIEKAEITTAVQIDENERRKIAEYLGRITGKRVVLTEKVDPSIIGGVIARVGGKIIDGSTRNQLNAMKNELSNAGR